jgi:hypothetical protein
MTLFIKKIKNLFSIILKNITHFYAQTNGSIYSSSGAALIVNASPFPYMLITVLINLIIRIYYLNIFPYISGDCFLSYITYYL